MQLVAGVQIRTEVVDGVEVWQNIVTNKDLVPIE